MRFLESDNIQGTERSIAHDIPTWPNSTGYLLNVELSQEL